MHKVVTLSLGTFSLFYMLPPSPDPRCPLDNEMSPYTMYIYNICKGRLGSRFGGRGKGCTEQDCILMKCLGKSFQR